VTGEHKNLKEPLTAFMDYLEQMNILMNEEKSRSQSLTFFGRGHELFFRKSKITC
jgi:hypothetical protein